MTKEIWINLPVKDVVKTEEFFTQLGFAFHAGHGDANSVCMVMGEKNIAVLFFEQEMFKGFTRNAVTDTAQSTEVLLSFDAESPAEVDALAAKVENAGGTLFGKPDSIQGRMYGCGFTDPDGHRWNVLHMDRSKMPTL